MMTPTRAEEAVSPYVAEYLAHQVVGNFDGLVRATMIINDNGVILARARNEEFTESDEIPGDVVPRLIHLPRHGISIFVRLAPTASEEAIHNRIASILASSKKGASL
jgi:hypothetical protein